MIQLRDVNLLLSRYRIPRRQPTSVCGYPPGHVPERLWREWLRVYDEYRVELIGKVMRAGHGLQGRQEWEVRKLLLQRDATAARLAEKAVRLADAG